ncbi:uncharacterized protein FIBRA_05635 [Fibroporia radiculosa]|uniref:Pet127-domain-containing protein n=1 Tax=Fibroporia radiculosa TaxID=599839 RepID=J4IAU1_9APHY|nr:uncharacterized protein FIBRA_05635 [Fibroporia radiculosa]CCM03501.1 predicted protein [Fibroporia radiculosa]
MIRSHNAPHRANRYVALLLQSSSRYVRHAAKLAALPSNSLFAPPTSKKKSKKKFKKSLPPFVPKDSNAPPDSIARLGTPTADAKFPFRSIHSVLSSTKSEHATDNKTHPERLNIRDFLLKTTVPQGPPKLPFYNRRVENVLPSRDDMLLQELQPVSSVHLIPRLEHGLKRVLTNPGYHWLQEPRSGTFNYLSWLQKVPDVETFPFERVTGFTTSSRDDNLISVTKSAGCRFAGSTSSLTGMLSQIYLLLSNEKPINLSTLSAHFQKESKLFTPGQRMPVSVTLRYRNGVYATDSDAGNFGGTETILSRLGVVLERFLTMLPTEYTHTYRKNAPVPLPLEKVIRKDVHRYSKFGDFVMRAQLDCRSPALPGTGIFDIKTRAAGPIRYDLANYKDYLGYAIRYTHGPWESFEKEYYDLIRSAFLKYSFQARIGHMDGIFVAYHNTAEIFGFQYIPLEEMDQRLFGHAAGTRVFNKCIGLLEAIHAEIVSYFPEQDVNCTWETVGGQLMHVWIEPAQWSAEEKPIVQLNIELTHYLNNEEVSGRVAVGSKDSNWLVHYTIVKSPLAQDLVRQKRASAYERQLLIYKYSLDANEKVDRGTDIDLQQLGPAAQGASSTATASSSRAVPEPPKPYSVPTTDTRPKAPARVSRAETRRLTRGVDKDKPALEQRMFVAHPRQILLLKGSPLLVRETVLGPRPTDQWRLTDVSMSKLAARLLLKGDLAALASPPVDIESIKRFSWSPANR